MKEYINIFEHASELTKALSSGGVLLSTAKDGKVNAMTMGWAFIGQLWEEPYVIALVRAPRYTHDILEGSSAFTISVPDSSTDRKILGYCGSRSGRDTDKIKDLGLTEVEADENGVPGFKELPLTIECEVTCRLTQTPDTLPKDILEGIYQDGQFHTLYFGKVLRAYRLR